ncbi:hypothetical protein GGQ74_002164 [Desulfobaculum xiamenense]|uniref:Class III cytochrome C domain-containing protein n=1 Tax=Desulfobaculum xiamenense TaxID=995050 RepID=A0A846QK23_9BACT|nr:cytochrome c3 family protein [Desulfobaculum xiamenense]NJB68491.1 hypothetical protein [Desulfobaculum xiamenense]
MMKGRSLLRWAGMIVFLAAFSVWGIEAGAVSKPATPKEKRADLLVIDALASYGELDEKPVPFFHDKHTEALAQQGKDCASCHEKDADGRMSTAFKRLANVSLDADKAVYHDNCIGCHSDQAAAGLKTGPTDAQCRSCHREAPAAAGRVSAGFDTSLHYRHVASKAIPAAEGQDANCAACHHVLDKATDKLVYAKGEEGSCRYCHEEKATKDVKSIRQAAHAACVTCHLDVKATKAETGPVTCAGCHDSTTRTAIKKAEAPERLMRGQADAVLLTIPGEKAAKADKPAAMAPVAFDHKAHEAYVDNCRSCHHKAIESCSKTCHTLEGNEKGGFVTFEAAMHKKDSDRSCIGCHNERKTDKTCAGCHTVMTSAETDPKNCATCHVALPEHAGTNPARLSDEEKKAAASMLIAARKPHAGIYEAKLIPEKVTIDGLVDQYEGAEFPHRKIVDAMFAKIQDSDLAGTFHTDKGTFCQGCHHNSPASATPPNCASCHKQGVNDDASVKPGLKAAYHRQCIGCHEAMAVEKPKATACVECHKERKK